MGKKDITNRKHHLGVEALRRPSGEQKSGRKRLRYINLRFDFGFSFDFINSGNEARS